MAQWTVDCPSDLLPKVSLAILDDTYTDKLPKEQGWGGEQESLFFFLFFFFFFQKVASNPTEYREDHFKLYPQVISPVSLNKKKKLLLESNSKGTIFSYRLGGMGEGEGEFLRSHGFRSEGDYRKLTAIRGGTMIISQSLGWGGG